MILIYYSQKYSLLSCDVGVAMLFRGYVERFLDKATNLILIKSL